MYFGLEGDHYLSWMEECKRGIKMRLGFHTTPPPPIRCGKDVIASPVLKNGGICMPLPPNMSYDITL